MGIVEKKRERGTLGERLTPRQERKIMDACNYPQCLMLPAWKHAITVGPLAFLESSDFKLLSLLAGVRG